MPSRSTCACELGLVRLLAEERRADEPGLGVGPGERLGERVEEHVLALPRAQPADHARPGTGDDARGGACGSDRHRRVHDVDAGPPARAASTAVASELAMIAVGTTRAAVRTILTTDAGW